MGIRYSKINVKNKREIVLLKGKPCVYGKCTFCNYIEDNSEDENEINHINFEVLENITGEYGVLEVINSGSVFELPKETLEKILEIATNKNINTIWFEVYYTYKNRLKEIIDFFDGIEIKFKVGVESFDENFRNNVLNKNLYYNSLEEFKTYFENICLMVGILDKQKK